MLGPKGMAFDNDEILDDNDDEDLKNDPVSQMDMQVSVQALLRTYGFWCVVFLCRSRTYSHFCVNAQPVISTILRQPLTNFHLKRCSLSVRLSVGTIEELVIYPEIVYNDRN